MSFICERTGCTFFPFPYIYYFVKFRKFIKTFSLSNLLNWCFIIHWHCALDRYLIGLTCTPIQNTETFCAYMPTKSFLSSREQCKNSYKNYNYKENTDRILGNISEFMFLKNINLTLMYSSNVRKATTLYFFAFLF